MTYTAAAIGTFDGVHLGHVAVLSVLKEESEQRGLKPTAISFDRHPLALIDPDRAPLAITTTEKKENLIAKTGVTPVTVAFDEKLRNMHASEWMQKMHDDMGVRLLVVGYDNTFGCDGVALSISDYRELGQSIGIEVIEAPYISGISSSAIRKAISAGKIEDANRMLGRRFLLPGYVVDGNKLGRTIGFPTANLSPLPGIVVPAPGVYASQVITPDGTKTNAVVNIGTRPTVRRGNDMTIEAHLIGWHGDLYGLPISIVFHQRLRDEVRFNSIQALKDQIEKDTAQTQLMLQNTLRRK